MTNSTDKLKKKKGPLRTEALVPALVVFVLFAAYGHFFFDSHLRKALEWSATYVHGAEVNVANIKTSLIGGYLEIRGIQVTDKKKPTHNMVSLGKIRFQVLWDALLRAKFVVNQAAVEQISLQSPRKKLGWVRPPAKDPKKSTAIEKLEQNALAQLEEDNQTNVLGDVAKIAGGVDEKDVLKNLQGQLQAEKKIDELSAALKEKEALWKKRIAELPDKKDFEDLEKRAKALKFNSKDPRSFAKDLKTLNTLVKEADGKIKEFNSTGKGLKGDVNGFKGEIANIDDWIKKDIEDIEKRLNIPKLDGANFSKSLFMRMISDRIVGLQKYAAVAREYMPPPKDQRSQKEQIVPRKRGQGKNIDFPRTKGYPLFWVQTADISSEATESGFSGNISGRLTDLTSNPKLVGKPTLLSFKGDFPNQGVSDIKGLVTIDHLTDKPREELDLRIGHFPVKNLKLSDSSDVKLSLAEAKGSSILVAKMESRQLDMKVWNEFKDSKYDMEAQSKVVKEVLGNVLGGLPAVQLNAAAVGPFGDLDIDVDSNLGRELSKGFSRYIKEKTEAVKAKIRDQIRAKVDGKKSELDKEFGKLRSQVDKTLKGKEKEIEQAKNEIKQSGKSKADSSKKQMKDDLKEKGKELLKKLKF